jgi:hypothetical protein
MYLNNGLLSPSLSSCASVKFSLTSSSLNPSFCLFRALSTNSRVHAVARPMQMKPNDTPYPVWYLGASLSKKMFVPTKLPILPAASVHARPIDRFHDGARLLPVQALIQGNNGYVPIWAKMMENYSAPTFSLTLVASEKSTARATVSTMSGPAMNGKRHLKRSAILPVTHAAIPPQKYGGIVRSCAVDDVNPSCLMICGIVNLNAALGTEFAHAIMIPAPTFQSNIALKKRFHENLSPSSVAVITPSETRRVWMKSRSSSDNHLARSGESTIRNGTTSPTATVIAPSRRKIQRHPSYPPVPSIFAMANARRPEKAPENADAV